MAFHSESLGIKEYIQETYPQFITPIETALWAHWKPGTDIRTG
jgi:hypothetical protein